MVANSRRGGIGGEKEAEKVLSRLDAWAERWNKEIAPKG
jgi:hypothetical protein